MSIEFRKILIYQVLLKSVQWQAELFHTDGQTRRILIIAFRSFAKLPKKITRQVWYCYNDVIIYIRFLRGRLDFRSTEPFPWNHSSRLHLWEGWVDGYWSCYTVVKKPSVGHEWRPESHEVGSLLRRPRSAGQTCQKVGHDTPNKVLSLCT